jgi:PadR family transcriptional regulator, regulatory protein PadR
MMARSNDPQLGTKTLRLHTPSCQGGPQTHQHSGSPARYHRRNSKELLELAPTLCRISCMGRMTLQTQSVLRVLLDHPLQQHYGLEISKAAGLPSGSLYPILAKLERIGWVTSDWEQVDEHEVGRPRRRYYQLTPDGAIRAEELLAATLKQLSPQPRSQGQARPDRSSPLRRPGWGAAR